METTVLDGLYYSESHEYVRIEGEEAWIGITDYAQKALGNIVYVDLPEEGDELEAESDFGAVESVKAASDLIAPVSGEVISVNEELEDTPELLNKAPYDNPIVKVRLADAAELDKLMTAEQYRELINK